MPFLARAACWAPAAAFACIDVCGNWFGRIELMWTWGAISCLPVGAKPPPIFAPWKPLLVGCCCGCYWAWFCCRTKSPW